MPRTYEIHVLDEDDPIVVEKCEHELAGVRFTDAEGHQVFLPWHRVEGIRSYRTPDEPPVAADVDAPVPVEAEPAPPEGTGDTEPAGDAEPDGKGGKASEWADADPDVVRAWAREQGKDVKDSGPIPKSVLSAYAAAHSD